MLYKIAVVTQDNQNVSSHFGMAPIYRVLMIENGQVIGEEERIKPHHAHHPDHSQHTHESSHDVSHADMFAPIADCKVLICGGMGQPAYQKAVSTGLEIVLTGGKIESAVQAYLKGEALTDLGRVH